MLRGHKGSIDSVRMVTEDSYISGGQDGAVSLWKDTQKKPISTIVSAHGDDHGVPCWITSTTAVKVSDLALTGSYDGFVRLWKVNATDSHSKSLQNVSKIPIEGFVNDLAVSQSSKVIVAGMGQEHRLGRWWHKKGNLNKVIVWTRNDTDEK